MKNRDPQIQEEGFHLLESHASDYVHELIEEFNNETDHGLRCWLLELIGSAKSPVAFDFLAIQLRSEDEHFRYWAHRGLEILDTKEARTLRWEAQATTGLSLEETEENIEE